MVTTSARGEAVAKQVQTLAENRKVSIFSALVGFPVVENEFEASGQLVRDGSGLILIFHCLMPHHNSKQIYKTSPTDRSPWHGSCTTADIRPPCGTHAYN